MTDIKDLAAHAGLMILDKDQMFFNGPMMQCIEDLVRLAQEAERKRLAAALKVKPLNDTAHSIAIWIEEGGNA